MAAQAPRCVSHVESRLHCAAGHRRTRRNTSGVANAQGIHENRSVKNRRSQEWCMPSARITKTVCVASNNPMPAQMAAIQNHRGESKSLRGVPMVRIVFYDSARVVGKAANRPPCAVTALAFFGTQADTVRSPFMRLE